MEGGVQSHVNGCVRSVRVTAVYTRPRGKPASCAISLKDADAASSIEHLEVDDYYSSSDYWDYWVKEDARPQPLPCGCKALFLELAEFLKSPQCSIAVLSLKFCHLCLNGGLSRDLLGALCTNKTVRDLTVHFREGDIPLLQNVIVNNTTIRKLRCYVRGNELATLEPLVYDVQHSCFHLDELRLQAWYSVVKKDKYRFAKEVNKAILCTQQNASRMNRVLDIAHSHQKKGGAAAEVDVDGASVLADAYEIISMHLPEGTPFLATKYL